MGTTMANNQLGGGRGGPSVSPKENFLKKFKEFYNGSNSRRVLTSRSQWYCSLTFDQPGNEIETKYKHYYDNFGIYVSDLAVRDIKQTSAPGAQNEIINEIGTFHGVGFGGKIQPSTLTNLEIKFFDTDVSIVDTMMYEWVLNTSKNQPGIYPHIRGKLYIDVFDNMSQNICTTYIIHGIYPYLIDLINFRYDAAARLSTRTVTFKFNNIEIITENNSPIVDKKKIEQSKKILENKNKGEQKKQIKSNLIYI